MFKHLLTAFLMFYGNKYSKIVKKCYGIICKVKNRFNNKMQKKEGKICI